MPAELENLQGRVRLLINSIYEKRHSPIPGAILMPALTADLREADGSSDVKALLRSFGFRSFAAFMQDVPDIVFQRQPGSDFLVSPAGTQDITKVFARPVGRIRRDFWRAFIEFPNPDTIRVYDANEDKIVYQPANLSPIGPVIEPVPAEIQLGWRSQFSEETPEAIRAKLLDLLKSGGKNAFNDFARFVREHPEIGWAWNRYLQSTLTGEIERWALANNLRPKVWESSNAIDSKRPNLSKRSEIYGVLDRIPVEELLKLSIPLEWLLAIARDR